jgi:hypothetical protein
MALSSVPRDEMPILFELAFSKPRKKSFDEALKVDIEL